MCMRKMCIWHLKGIQPVYNISNMWGSDLQCYNPVTDGDLATSGSGRYLIYCLLRLHPPLTQNMKLGGEPATGTVTRASNESQKKFREYITITEKAPSTAISWLQAPTSAFAFQTQLRHYAKQALTYGKYTWWNWDTKVIRDGLVSLVSYSH